VIDVATQELRLKALQMVIDHLPNDDVPWEEVLRAADEIVKWVTNDEDADE
jgi:hypothetical protein